MTIDLSKNTLCYGDNLEVLRLHVPDQCVDLIYLDPPFNSNATYNILFAEQNGKKSRAQIKAFTDTWHWDQGAEQAYVEVVETSGRVSDAMQAFRKLLGENDMMAYLAMMAPRLKELRRVLKPTGSIYLHCDPTASHYLKLLMDAVFGPENFCNEIIWYFKTGGLSKRWFGRKHQTMFFYSRTGQYRFAPQKEKSYLMHKYGFSNIEIHKDEDGFYTWVYMRDVWDIPALRGNQPEMLGYPTQKPEALLERIIRASSNDGDLVLDPFCGCGTTVCAAQRLNRRWIGIDVTHLAVALIKSRLRDAFGEQETTLKARYDVIGEPKDLEGARQLAKDDRYQFQWWALGLAEARPVEQKKGADKGIDGRLYFHDEAEGGQTKQIVFSVKAGKTGVAHVRDLRGVVERENAAIGVLISMEEPTRDMRKEAAAAALYESPFWQKRYPRLQLITVGDLLEGKRIDAPPRRTSVTFKRAPKARNCDDHETKEMELGTGRGQE
ncbi:MAG: restriction endonuclease [Candidatus Coatesbacteria bacterium]|nr:restriction endonuclease [Candidatus Coatesbacteria bacterium]